MNTNDVHKYNTGERVKVFFTESPDLAPAGSRFTRSSPSSAPL